MVNLVSDALQKALEDGETLEDFKKRIADAITKQGWKDYRVETIFRANMQSAYAAGRYRKMRAVKLKSRPYWQYLAIMDKRTRPSHAILHGKVYPADHEFWQTNHPPNGFAAAAGWPHSRNVRSKAQNLAVEKDMPKGRYVDRRSQNRHKIFCQLSRSGQGLSGTIRIMRTGRKNGGNRRLAGIERFRQSLKRTRAKKPAPKPDIYERGALA